MSNNKLKKDNKSKYKILAFIILVCILIISGIIISMLFKDYPEYQEVAETQEKVIDEVVEDVSDDNEDISIEWNKLKSINEDVIAWIVIPDTNIDYPIVQGDNDNQYLHRSIYGKYSKGGTIFVEANNIVPFEDVNTIIYGHNLMNNKMFSDLRRYTNKKYAESHNIVYIYLPNGEKREYKVVSFHKVKADDVNIYNPYVENVSDYKEYMMKNNKISSEYQERTGDKVITLSTCTNGNDNERYVLHAVYSSEQEG